MYVCVWYRRTVCIYLVQVFIQDIGYTRIQDLRRHNSAEESTKDSLATLNTQTTFQPHHHSIPSFCTIPNVRVWCLTTKTNAKQREKEFTRQLSTMQYTNQQRQRSQCYAFQASLPASLPACLSVNSKERRKNPKNFIST